MRDPWSGELLDWNAAERLRRSVLGDDPTAAFSSWFWRALRVAAAQDELFPDPTEVLGEAWLAAAGRLRSRYGERWREAGALFTSLREERIGGRDLLSREQWVLHISVTRRLEQRIAAEARWRERHRPLPGDLAAGGPSPDGGLDPAQARARLAERVPERYLRVLEQRAEGLTLEEIGRGLGVTRERARQLEKKGLEKARTALKSSSWSPVRSPKGARQRALQERSGPPSGEPRPPELEPRAPGSWPAPAHEALPALAARIRWIDAALRRLESHPSLEERSTTTASIEGQIHVLRRVRKVLVRRLEKELPPRPVRRPRGSAQRRGRREGVAAARAAAVAVEVSGGRGSG